ncbi:MAG: hypothetical protein KGJ66_08765 [Alphaproteobacteria bacterium]|nr:hypothetical protein [Alphaproteobacteria bacterium]
MAGFLAGLVNSLPSVAAIVAVGGFVFSVVKWYDVRSRQLKKERWQDYTNALSTAWGWKDGEINKPVGAAEQIVAVYRLIEFEEYAFITVAGLERASGGGTAGWIQLFGLQLMT